MTRNAPTTAYGTTNASPVAISTTWSRGASAILTSAAIVRPTPTMATASNAPAAGAGCARGDQARVVVALVLTMSQTLTSLRCTRNGTQLPIVGTFSRMHGSGS